MRLNPCPGLRLHPGRGYRCQLCRRIRMGPQHGASSTSCSPPPRFRTRGLDRVLDNITGAGATAVSPTLGVYAPSRPGEGSREPPLDVSGEVRLLDRPLWGRRELWPRGYSPHPPDPAIWAEVPYSPPPLAPPELRIDVVRGIVDGARARGLAVEIQVSPFTLPGAPGGQSIASGHGMGADSDRPRRLDGTVAEQVRAAMVPDHRHGLRPRPPGGPGDALQAVHLPLADDDQLVGAYAPRLDP